MARRKTKKSTKRKNKRSKNKKTTKRKNKRRGGMRKGSAAAKAWGRKMKALRKGGGKKGRRKGKGKKKGRRRGHRKGVMPAGLRRYHANRAARRHLHGMTPTERAKHRHHLKRMKKAARRGRGNQRPVFGPANRPSGMVASLRERLLGDSSIQQRLAAYKARMAAKRASSIDVPAGVAL